MTRLFSFALHNWDSPPEKSQKPYDSHVNFPETMKNQVDKRTPAGLRRVNPIYFKIVAIVRLHKAPNMRLFILTRRGTVRAQTI